MTYALVDCNSFYASCERVFRPDLKDKPIVVLSNNDGCIIARSNEAKVLGIKMGVPVFKVKDIIENNNVYVFSTNFALYGDMSSRVMSLLTDMAPETEIYSIDEAFMNFNGIKNQLRVANHIRKNGIEPRPYFRRATVKNAPNFKLTWSLMLAEKLEAEAFKSSV